MKTLQESLFDNDLKEKDLKFRDVYDLFPDDAGMQVWGMPIGQIFSLNKVIKYKNPYHPDKGFFNDYSAGFLGIIMDMPVPSKSDFNKGMYCDWCQKLLSKQYLGKYVRSSWKLEYDRKFEVALKTIESFSSGLISLELRNGDVGGYIFTFKMKGTK